MKLFKRHNNVLPGFGLTLGFTLFYLSVIVLIPLSALVFRTTGLTWGEFISTVTAPRVLASYKVTYGAAMIAAVINSIFGVLVAWVLVRYRFPGRRIVDALVDLPFALPTAVAGITLATIYSPNGWVGRYLEPLGVKVAFTPLGITLAMTFIGLPFVVRTVQPVVEEIEVELEEAAVCLGATRWQTLVKLVLISASPGIFSASMIGFGRAIGETMIVLMATGNTPIMDWSLFNGFRTLSANIAVEIPEAPHGGTLYRILFLAAMLLFVFTFLINTVAEIVRQRLRTKYSQY